MYPYHTPTHIQYVLTQLYMYVHMYVYIKALSQVLYEKYGMEKSKQVTHTA